MGTHGTLVQDRDRSNREISPRITFQSKLARSGKYRPEIDGLRAIAVLPVLFFHAKVAGFPGGFVGVDIFYVISGYLITSIIAKDVTLGRFSYVSFYDRRIRRIFPALFAVVFFSVLAGSVLLAPKDFFAFGRSLIAMTFFVSNIFFKREGGIDGYFGRTSDSQPLLHTWTLSVEEQFYLFFPTALILLTRWAKRRTIECLWIVVIISFFVNVWATHYRPRSAFIFLYRGPGSC
jgi:peptidoglycan/LPS O-acetylase OafA/YrhL